MINNTQRDNWSLGIFLPVDTPDQQNMQVSQTYLQLLKGLLEIFQNP